MNNGVNRKSPHAEVTIRHVDGLQKAAVETGLGKHELALHAQPGGQINASAALHIPACVYAVLEMAGGLGEPPADIQTESGWFGLSLREGKGREATYGNK